MKFLLSCTAILCLLALVGCNSEPTPAAVAPKLNLKISQEGTSLLIKNNEALSVQDCWVQVNTVFEKRGVSLGGNDETSLPLSELTKSDGTRFNVYEQDVKGILVQCFNPNRAVQFGSM